MAGGIFINQPFSFNIKCVIFGFITMALYQFGGMYQNWLLLPIIFLISYVLMAYYDYLYNCDIVMYSGTGLTNPLVTSIFKLQLRSEKDADRHDKSIIKAKAPFVENQERAYLKKVYIFHLLLVAPILLYVGIKGNSSDPKVYGLVLSLVLILLVYHSLRLWVPRDTSC